MPSTRIATGAWARGNERALCQALQDALASALELPEWDRDIIVDCYDASQREIPAERSDRFTRVEIALFQGRTLETKRKLYAAIVANLEDLGIPPTETKILLLEIPRENWGLRGGTPGSEIDLGFKIDI